MSKIVAIIAAGGSGNRMGKPKQLLPINGKPMLEWTISAFKKVNNIDEIIVATIEDNFKFVEKLGCYTAAAGQERQDSIRNALDQISDDTEIVLVHDGARPLVTPKIIRRSISECKKSEAVVVGVPVKDTIKVVNNEWEIVDTLDRGVLWAAQTPQVFKYETLKQAYTKATIKATDDSRLVENLGVHVQMILGSYENIKVTTPEDLIIAEELLKGRIKN
ncbi:2-C-methyl-D-erythritol 4-phosphate cytidylyltransferase [Candidatus Margulisiibacteriota bacterium]